MKKTCLFITFFMLSFVLSGKIYADEPDFHYSVEVQADNTANAWMQAITASLQTDAYYVKIGGYAGGTDTAKKWAAVKNDIADALGISVATLENMTGVDVINAFFTDISGEDIGQITSGTSSIVGVTHAATNAFNIYVGPEGTDVITDPSYILHFQLHR